ncbi:MAG: RNA 2',3'-cyclic phosphodiesterase [Chloroflexi bacterium]|nr:RNA 2',3'-cyclic phosphodiesterase [Chloroflexota bacterium]
MRTGNPDLSGGSDQLRLFVAVELPDEVKQALDGVEAQLERRMSGLPGARPAEQALKLVNPAGIHITLKFLGCVPAGRIREIEEALGRAFRSGSPFRLSLGSLGVFPSFSRPRVVWVGVTGDLERLASLQAQVETEMAALGFAVEKRPFNPHLTLARVRESTGIAETRLIGQAVKDLSATPIHAPDMVVRGASLMRSQIFRQGAHYSCLAHFEFRDLSS